MTNLIKWAKNNQYKYEVANLQNGGQCVFIEIDLLKKTMLSKLLNHLKRVKLRFEYAGYYTSIRVDFMAG